MKKMTIIHGVILSLLAVSAPLYANVPAQVCPSVAALISGGLNASITERVDEAGAWGVGQVGQYGTPEVWGFGMFVPYAFAKNPTQAFDIANAALPTITATNTVPDYQDGVSLCTYNANGLVVAAITPIPVNGMAKRLIKAKIPR